MKYLISENQMMPVLHKLLNSMFNGFDDIHYDWAEFNCGMGVCCDPYSIGFVLPKNDYNDYLFNLVDGDNYDPIGDYPEELKGDLPEVCHESPDIKDPRFDTIIFYEVFAEDIEDFLGPKENWELSLLDLINKTYHIEASNILFI
jgi:hypothetical protein